MLYFLTRGLLMKTRLLLLPIIFYSSLGFANFSTDKSRDIPHELMVFFFNTLECYERTLIESWKEGDIEVFVDEDVLEGSPWFEYLKSCKKHEQSVEHSIKEEFTEDALPFRDLALIKQYIEANVPFVSKQSNELYSVQFGEVTITVHYCRGFMQLYSFIAPNALLSQMQP